MEASCSIHRKEFNKIIDPLIRGDLAVIDDLQLKLESILSQYLGYANSSTGGYGVSFGETPFVVLHTFENMCEIIASY